MLSLSRETPWITLRTQMGREVLEGLRVSQSQQQAAPILQENQQTDHYPSRYSNRQLLTLLALSANFGPFGIDCNERR